MSFDLFFSLISFIAQIPLGLFFFPLQFFSMWFGMTLVWSRNVWGTLWLFDNHLGTMVNGHRWGVQAGAFSTRRVSHGCTKGMLE
jgi:hypothetical protein